MQSVIISVSQQHVVRVSRTHWQNLRMLCQSMFIIAMRISIFQSLLFERSIQHFFSILLPVFMEVFIFLSRPDTSNGRVDFSTDGSSRPDRIVTIRRDICSFPGSSTSGSRAYFLFKLHDPTSGESGRQQQLTTRLSSCILDMCATID